MEPGAERLTLETRLVPDRALLSWPHPQLGTRVPICELAKAFYMLLMSSPDNE